MHSALGWRGVVLAGATALAWIGIARAASAQEQLTIRLDFSPWGVHAAMHLAQEKGWFEEEGLVVDIQDGRGSGNTLQLVNAGQVDVGQIQTGLIPQARDGGATVKSFALWGRRTDLAVLVDRDSGIDTIAELEGKSLVVFAASPWAPFIDTFLEAGGLDRQKTEIMFVDPAALWATYTAGRADGLMSTVPSAVPIAEGPRPSDVVLASDAGVIFPSYGLIATERTIEEREDALRRLAHVQARAWEHIKDGHVEEGVQAIMAQRADARLDPDVLRHQIELTIEYFDTPETEGLPIGAQTEAYWTEALTFMEQAGAIRPGWNASDYFTNAFFE